MIFARRNQLSFSERVKSAVWPRSGWPRALRYFSKRILRLSGSPHDIAVGFAVGMFVAWSPLFGVHYLMALALAFVARGNVIAALLATSIGNPITGPAMWALDYEVGALIEGRMHRHVPHPIVGHGIEEKLHSVLPVLEPLLIGWLVLGLVSATVSYFIVGYAVRTFQHARRQRLEARRLDRAMISADGPLTP